MVWHQRLAVRLLIPMLAVATLAIGILLLWPEEDPSAQRAPQAARVAAVALAVVVALIYLFLRVLVLQPMKALLEWVDRSRSRQQAEPIEVDAVGEIGALVAAFNEMIDARRGALVSERDTTTELSSLSSILARITRSMELAKLQRIVSDLLLESLPDLQVAGTVVRPTRGSRLRVCLQVRGSPGVREHELEADELDRIGDLVDPAVVRAVRDGDEDLPSRPPAGGTHALALPGPDAGSGGLIVLRLQRGRTLGEREGMVLRTLAAHVGMAVENARLYALVITDELTQLYTVRFFQQTLAREVENYHRYGQKLSLLMLDLDDFKRVNDEHGHPVGDRVLQRVAAVLRACVREVDVVCRYGGEEFAVILPGTDGRAAGVVAERIRGRVGAEGVQVNGTTIRTTVSVGISSCPDDATSVRELVVSADRALYAAKQAGKDRVVAA